MSRQIIIAAFLLLMPAFTLASSVVRTGDEASFAQDQKVEGDFYWLAESPIISGEVTEDLLVVGGEVTANGKVGGDVLVVGGAVDLHGDFGDDVRIVGGEVTIAGEVKGDLVVVAGNVNVLSTAKIGGDVLFFGGEADISGEVGKSILGTNERLRIDGVVTGDVQVRTGQLLLGERSVVSGLIQYSSVNELIRAQGAEVEGKISKETPLITTNTAEIKDLLIPFLILIFAALVWYLLFNKFLNKVSTQTNNHPLRSLLIGFGLLFVTPVAVLILLFSTLGSFLGVTLIFIYFAIIFASVTITGIMTGMYVMKLLGKNPKLSITTIVFGMLVSYLVMFIPVFGPLIFFVLMLSSMGALTTILYRIIRSD
jgi:cytoskeletal protein CcmA (bactofilin family)